MVESEKRRSLKSTPSKSAPRAADKSKRPRNCDTSAGNQPLPFPAPPMNPAEAYSQMMMAMMSQMNIPYQPQSANPEQELMALQNAMLTHYYMNAMMQMYQTYGTQFNGQNVCPIPAGHYNQPNNPTLNGQCPQVDKTFTAPLERGWRRLVLIRSVHSGTIEGSVVYQSPEGQRFASLTEIDISASGELSLNNFNFDPNLVLGDFYDDSHAEVPLTYNQLAEKLNRCGSTPVPQVDPNMVPGVVPDPYGAMMGSVPQDYQLYNYLMQMGMAQVPPVSQTVNQTFQTPKKTEPLPQRPTAPQKVAESPKPKESPVKKSPAKPKEAKPISITTKRGTKTEDLRLKNNRQLPRLKRLSFEGIDHQTISDCLQTIEFIGAFGDVLKLSSHGQISLRVFIQAFNNCAESMEMVIQLFMSLLQLVLPLDTTNRYYRSINSLLRYCAKHCTVTWHNCSELFSYLISIGDQAREGVGEMRSLLDSRWLFGLPSRRIGWAFAYVVERLVVSPRIAELIDCAFEDITSMRRHQVRLQRETRTRVPVPKEVENNRTSEEESTGSDDRRASDQRGKRNFKIPKNADLKGEMTKLNRRIRCPFLGHDRYYRKYFVLHSSKAVFVDGHVSSGIEVENPRENISDEFKCGWFSLDDVEQVKSLSQNLLHGGVREGTLEHGINKHYGLILGLLSSKSSQNEPAQESAETLDVSRACYTEFWRWIDDIKLSVCDCITSNRPQEGLAPEDDESVLLRKCREHLLSLKRSIDPRILLPPMGNSNEIAQQEIGQRWERMVESAGSTSQLGIFAEFLRDSIAWDRIYNKLVCQICQEGENEQLLLICDVCNQGFHSYCTKPPLEAIPEGDWFCPQCRNKQSVSPEGDCCFVCGENGSKCDSFGGSAGIGGDLITCISCGVNVHVECVSVKMTRFSCSKWQCRACEVKSGVAVEDDSPRKRRRTKQKAPKKPQNPLEEEETEFCRRVISSLEAFEECDPFLTPVDCRRVPNYRRVIEFPMDFSTISKKLRTGRYGRVEEVGADFRLIFDNCEKFNEDSSYIGECGYFMRGKFEQIWSAGPFCDSL